MEYFSIKCILELVINTERILIKNCQYIREEFLESWL